MRLSLRNRPRKSAAQRALGRWHPRAMALVSPQTNWRLALLETLGVMLVVAGLSAWLRPHDPLWITHGFTWMWLVVAIMALRYGSAHAMVAMSVVLVLWLALDRWHAPLGDFPRLTFIGGLVLTLICGEVSDFWSSRLHDAQAVNAYVDERLQTLTQHHFLLSISHDRLEQELLSRPFTLRETLAELRQRIRPDAQNSAALPSAEWLLQLLAQSCRIESAALFAIRDHHLDEKAVAILGHFGEGDENNPASGKLDTADPMLALALQTGELAHVQNDPFIDADQPSRYLICAPIVASSGNMMGVLVVERIAFTALTLETLQFLSVLLSYYGDSLDFSAVTAPLLVAWPQCPPDFAIEAVRLQRLHAEAFIQSSIVAFALPASVTAAEAWSTRLEQLRRTLDVAWTYVSRTSRTHLVLLPLTDELGRRGYIERIERALQEQFGVALSPEVSVHTYELNETDLVAQLRTLLDRTDPPHRIDGATLHA